MLVLTRKQGETLRIGDDIVITIVRTKGKAARLGIAAPPHVPVLRGEVAASIEIQERRKAAAAASELVAAAVGDSEPPAASRPTIAAVRSGDAWATSDRSARAALPPLRELLCQRRRDPR